MMSKPILAEHAIVQRFRLAKAASSVFSIRLVYYFLWVHVLKLKNSFQLASGLIFKSTGKLALLRGLIDLCLELGCILVIFVDFLLQLYFE